MFLKFAIHFMFDMQLDLKVGREEAIRSVNKKEIINSNDE